MKSLRFIFAAMAIFCLVLALTGAYHQLFMAAIAYFMYESISEQEEVDEEMRKSDGE